MVATVDVCEVCVSRESLGGTRDDLVSSYCRRKKTVSTSYIQLGQKGGEGNAQSKAKLRLNIPGLRERSCQPHWDQGVGNCWRVEKQLFGRRSGAAE